MRRRQQPEGTEIGRIRARRFQCGE
jgi:hypothetical protein